MSKKTLYLCIFVFWAFWGIVAFFSYRNDIDFCILEPEDFSVPAELEVSISDGIIIIGENSKNDRQNFVISSPALYLEAGTYVLGVSYNSTSPDNYCRLYSPTTMDSEGNTGVIFDSQMMSAGEGRISFQVTFEQDVSNLELQICYAEGELIISEIAMRNTKALRDSILFWGMGSLILAVCFALYQFFKRKTEDVENRLLVVGFLLLLYITMLPYLNDYLIIGHDMKFHMARIEGIVRNIRNGNFGVGINPVQSYGYGYASSVMYPQLFLYPSAFLHLAGMSLMNSYKCLLLLINALTIGISYFSFNRLFSSRYAGIMGTYLYTLCSYRLTDVYVRGSIGEVLALAFIPLVFYSIYVIIYGDYKKWYWATIAFSAVFQSHILSTELIIIYTSFFCAGCWKHFVKETKRWIALCKAAIMTVLLNLWQIIPFVTYLSEDLTVFAKANIYLPDRVLTFSELFQTFVTENSKSIGGVLAIGTVLYIVLTISILHESGRDEKLVRYKRLGDVALIIAIPTIAMTLWIFPWDLFCRINVIDNWIKGLQFPWRLLGIGSFLLCIVFVAAAMILIHRRPVFSKTMVVFVCAFSIMGSLYLIENVSQLETIEGRAYAENMILTDYLYFYQGDSDEALKDRGYVVMANQKDIWQFCDFQKQGTMITVTLSAQKEHSNSWIEVPLYYYPGYRAYLDGNELELLRGNDGVIRIMIPDDLKSGVLNVGFEAPWMWKAANWISWTCLVIWGIYSVLKRKRLLK